MKTQTKWIKSLPNPEGILEKTQLINRRYLTESGFPEKANEAWRLTDLKKLEKLLEVPLKTKSNKHEYSNNIFTQKDKNNYLIINLGEANKSSKLAELPEGTNYLTEEEIEEKLNKLPKNLNDNEYWQLALNRSSTKTIIALKIDSKNTQHIDLIIPTDSEAFISTRVILIIKKESKVNLLEILDSKSISSISHSIEIYMEEGAEVKHGFIGLGAGDRSSLLNTILVEQDSMTHYSFTSILSGWNLCRIEPQIRQLKGNAYTQIKNLQITNNREQISMRSSIIFEGPDGTLDQINKSIANANSHCIFNGSVQVPRIAQKTNASQMSRNLLMSKRARIDTKPELEIIADDVKCIHGATVSQLQEDELFYLRSRGISTEQSKALLLEGYCQEVLDSLPLDPNLIKELRNILLYPNK
tara:strand:- start:7490 stop:8731 length:1242 start_codon:yes stop_codon:yes gene_type:complete